MVYRGNRVLPDQGLLRNQRAEITRDRAHVAVRELEPGAGERISELIRVFVEPPRDLLICRIEAQREIGGQHRGHALLPIERARYGCLAILGLPLFRSRRTGCQFPLVFEQILEKQVAPLGWRLRPDDFRTAGDGIGSGAGPTSDGSPAPWVLPKLWPPAISATVSSSFMAMRKNVSRISFAAATGSGLPLGPCGLT